MINQSPTSWSKAPHDLTNLELADQLRRLKQGLAAVDHRRDMLEEAACRLEGMDEDSISRWCDCYSLCVRASDLGYATEEQCRSAAGMDLGIEIEQR